MFWKMYLILKSKLFPASYAWDSIDSVKLNVDAILQLMDMCDKNNIGFLPVLIPSNPPQKTARSWRHFMKVLRKPLDLRDELNDDSFFVDKLHLSVKGHKYVGKRIHDRIGEYIRQINNKPKNGSYAFISK